MSVQIMYKKVDQLETESENFELPFGGKLAEDNRWVIMAKLIPWSEVEEEYAKNFTQINSKMCEENGEKLDRLTIDLI